MLILHLRGPDPICRVDYTDLSHLPPPTLSTLPCSGICVYGNGDLSGSSQEPRASEEVCPSLVFEFGAMELVGLFYVVWVSAPHRGGAP